MKILRTTEMLHPILANAVAVIQKEVIEPHNMPIRLFETGRVHDRHAMLIQRGKTKDAISKHLFDLTNDPPLYSTAIDYVFYDKKWSWNLRDSTTTAWYTLFGHKVLDVCPELRWSGMNRKNINYCHFELGYDILVDNIKKIPCVLP